MRFNTEVTMDWPTGLTDTALREHIGRLRRDIEDFDRRAGLQRASLEREHRFSQSDPLLQRFTSIGRHLGHQLRQAQEELERRRRADATSARRPFRATLAAWLGA
jgi:hypothetical protein